MNAGDKVLLGLGITGLALVGGGIAWGWSSARKPPLSPPSDDAPPPDPTPPPEDPAAPERIPRPRPGPAPKPGLDLDVPATSRLVGVLSQQATGGTWCDVPIVPRGTATHRGEVREVTGDPEYVWGWQGPGGKPLEQQPVRAFGAKFILALAYRMVTPHGWQGGDVDISSADFLAPSVHGVMADGLFPASMRPVLARFAAHDCVAYPEVRAGDRPRDRLGTIVDNWRNVGFSAIVPTLDVASGLDTLRELILECGRLNLTYMLASLQQIQGLGIGCSTVRPES